MSILPLLRAAIAHHASDLHVSAGMPAMVRIHGELQPLADDIITPHEVKNLVESIIPEDKKAWLAQLWDIDFAYQDPALGRFRVNIFQQARGLSMAIRMIPKEVIALETLNLPVLPALLQKPHGLILMTGSTGMGKSTTLASMLDYLNRTRALHILTIEDPVEYLHTPKKSLLQQREIGTHALNFSTALKSALREDPDVIMIGELRNLDTIRLALTAAETGHLVLATLHTQSAVKTIDRLIDVFPGDEKQLLRYQLSESLQAVISQTLVKRIDNTSRVAAFEVLINTPAVKNLIRENKSHQLYSVIETGREMGMQTLTQHLQRLANSGIIGA